MSELMMPNRSADNIPFVTTVQMREVDRAMEEDYGIRLIQMVENAGRNLALLASRRFLGGDPRDRRVLVLAGAGGNGAGGLVCARRLHNWGAEVHIVTAAASSQLRGVPRVEMRILRQMAVPVTAVSKLRGLPPADLVIDAIIGYSLDGAPRGLAGRLIQAANVHGAPVLALDVPSGVDATTGVAHDPAIRATATLTLALPKVGLRTPEAVRYTGELYLGDIGVPPKLYERAPLALKVGPIFASSDIIRLW